MIDETTPQADAREAPAYPDPRSRRRRPDIRGNAVALGGAEWLLADYVPSLHAGCWNEIFDGGVLGQHDHRVVLTAAMHLLRENYELDVAEAFALLTTADPQSLVEPVEAAIFGPGDEKYSSARSYSQWARFSFLKVGIDPDAVDPRERRPLLEFLVASGDTIGAAEWVGSAAAASRKMRGPGG